MSLIRPYNKLAVPNTVETKYINVWNIIESEVDKFLELAWKSDTRGDSVKALKYYKAANYYIYLFHYAINIDAYIEREGIDRNCISEEVFCRFKIQCVQDNLQCISEDLGGNYSKIWKDLAAELNIELEKECEPEVSGEFEYCAFETESFTKVVGTPNFNC